MASGGRYIISIESHSKYRSIRCSTEDVKSMQTQETRERTRKQPLSPEKGHTPKKPLETKLPPAIKLTLEVKHSKDQFHTQVSVYAHTSLRSLPMQPLTSSDADRSLADYHCFFNAIVLDLCSRVASSR